jgi:hypothetical protein
MTAPAAFSTAISAKFADSAAQVFALRNANQSRATEMPFERESRTHLHAPIDEPAAVTYPSVPFMNKRSKSAANISRREFARAGAIAAAAASAALPVVLIPELAAGQDAVHEPALSTASQAEADATVAAILRKYGSLLSDAEKLDVRRLVTEGMKPLEQLRASQLENSDQPGNVLRLYPDGFGSQGPITVMAKPATSATASNSTTGTASPKDEKK